MRAELVDFMGSDLSCVNAARVSFDKESEWGVETKIWDHDEGFPTEKEEESLLLDGYQDVTDPEHWTTVWEKRGLKEKDKKLISYLANHGHFTPFTHTAITLRETVPIFVARQRFKHVVGFTYNEVSRRYVDDEPEFYVPEVWRSRPGGSVKQGSGLPLDKKSDEYYQEYYTRLLDFAEEMYRQMIADGVAPEQARMVLPQSMYTSYYTTGSLAAFARAYRQRIDPHAQVEIQELAKQWDTIIRPLFPVSWSALTE